MDEDITSIKGVIKPENNLIKEGNPIKLGKKGLTEFCNKFFESKRPRIVKGGNFINIPTSTERSSSFGTKVKDFRFFKELGQGARGTVYLAKSRLNYREVAIKKVSVKELPIFKQKEILSEIFIQKQMGPHPHIIEYYSSFLEDEVIYLIMEYAHHGDLLRSIKKQKEKKCHFIESDIWHFLWELCMGLLHLHSSGLIHRDFKSLNILVTENYDLKISDFGECIFTDHVTREKGKVAGTPCYLAPEIIKQQAFDERVDVWGLGCVISELINMDHPFKGNTCHHVMNNIIFKNPQQIHTPYSPQLINLCTELLQKSMHKRPFLDEIITKFPGYTQLLIPIDEENLYKYTKKRKEKEPSTWKNTILYNRFKSKIVRNNSQLHENYMSAVQEMVKKANNKGTRHSIVNNIINNEYKSGGQGIIDTGNNTNSGYHIGHHTNPIPSQYHSRHYTDNKSMEKDIGNQGKYNNMDMVNKRQNDSHSPVRGVSNTREDAKLKDEGENTPPNSSLGSSRPIYTTEDGSGRRISLIGLQNQLKKLVRGRLPQPLIGEGASRDNINNKITNNYFSQTAENTGSVKPFPKYKNRGSMGNGVSGGSQILKDTRGHHISVNVNININMHPPERKYLHTSGGNTHPLSVDFLGILPENNYNENRYTGGIKDPSYKSPLDKGYSLPSNITKELRVEKNNQLNMPKIHTLDEKSHLNNLSVHKTPPYSIKKMGDRGKSTLHLRAEDFENNNQYKIPKSERKIPPIREVHTAMGTRMIPFVALQNPKGTWTKEGARYNKMENNINNQGFWGNKNNNNINNNNNENENKECKHHINSSGTRNSTKDLLTNYNNPNSQLLNLSEHKLPPTNKPPHKPLKNQSSASSLQYNAAVGVPAYPHPAGASSAFTSTSMIPPNNTEFPAGGGLRVPISRTPALLPGEPPPAKGIKYYLPHPPREVVFGKYRGKGSLGGGEADLGGAHFGINKAHSRDVSRGRVIKVAHQRINTAAIGARKRITIKDLF